MSEIAEQHDAGAPEVGENFIPLSEIAKHNSPTDIWMAINGKVYNVTKFIDQHPGGEEVIMEHAGSDATSAFEDVGHSEAAVEMLDDLYVGMGNPAELKIVARKSTGLGLDVEEESGNGKIMLIVCMLVVVAAYYYFKAMKD